MKKQKLKFKNWAKWSFIFAVIIVAIFFPLLGLNFFLLSFVFISFLLIFLGAYPPYYFLFSKLDDLNKNKPNLLTPREDAIGWALLIGIVAIGFLVKEIVRNNPMPWDSYPFTWSRMSQDPQSKDYQLFKAVVTKDRLWIGYIKYNDGRCQAYVHAEDGRNLIMPDYRTTGDILRKNEIFYFELNDKEACLDESPKNFTFYPYEPSWRNKKFTVILDSIAKGK